MPSPPPPIPYVVLHHTGVDQPHYDLLLDVHPDAPLLTVRCSTWPVTEQTTFTRLPDHRRHYLTYEGPVSDNRGHVRRVAQGTATIVADREDALTLRLNNAVDVRLAGSAESTTR